MRDSDVVDQPLYQHVGRIGNLLLLPMPLNAEAAAFPFAQKVKIYQKHNLRMILEVTEKQDWTIAEIELREAKIAAFAGKRWSDI